MTDDQAFTIINAIINQARLRNITGAEKWPDAKATTWFKNYEWGSLCLYLEDFEFNTNDISASLEKIIEQDTRLEGLTKEDIETFLDIENLNDNATEDDLEEYLKNLSEQTMLNMITGAIDRITDPTDLDALVGAANNDDIRTALNNGRANLGNIDLTGHTADETLISNADAAAIKDLAIQKQNSLKIKNAIALITDPAHLDALVGAANNDDIRTALNNGRANLGNIDLTGHTADETLISNADAAAIKDLAIQKQNSLKIKNAINALDQPTAAALPELLLAADETQIRTYLNDNRDILGNIDLTGNLNNETLISNGDAQSIKKAIIHKRAFSIIQERIANLAPNIRLNGNLASTATPLEVRQYLEDNKAANLLNIGDIVTGHIGDELILNDDEANLIKTSIIYGPELATIINHLPNGALKTQLMNPANKNSVTQIIVDVRNNGDDPQTLVDNLRNATTYHAVTTAMKLLGLNINEKADVTAILKENNELKLNKTIEHQEQQRRELTRGKLYSPRELTNWRTQDQINFTNKIDKVETKLGSIYQTLDLFKLRLQQLNKSTNQDLNIIKDEIAEIYEKTLELKGILTQYLDALKKDRIKPLQIGSKARIALESKQTKLEEYLGITTEIENLAIPMLSNAWQPTALAFLTSGGEIKLETDRARANLQLNESIARNAPIVERVIRSPTGAESVDITGGNPNFVTIDSYFDGKDPTTNTDVKAHLATQITKIGDYVKSDIHATQDEINKFKKVPDLATGTFFITKIPGKPILEWAHQVISNHIAMSGEDEFFKIDTHGLLPKMRLALYLCCKSKGLECSVEGVNPSNVTKEQHLLYKKIMIATHPNETPKKIIQIKEKEQEEIIRTFKK